MKLRLQHLQFGLGFDYGYFGLFEGKLRFPTVQCGNDLSLLDILTFHDLYLFQIPFPLYECFHLALCFEFPDCIDQVVEAFSLGGSHTDFGGSHFIAEGFRGDFLRFILCLGAGEKQKSKNS
jgi:hypothetical protein